MSSHYEELLEGERLLRFAPGARHECLVERLEIALAPVMAGSTVLRLLPRRERVELSSGTRLRPDLALVTLATGRLFLAVEVIESGDHRDDTVRKKASYEDHRLPRLWMVDPRYDNVEVYCGGAHGLALQRILAGAERLSEPLLPGFEIVISELFSTK